MEVDLYLILQRMEAKLDKVLESMKVEDSEEVEE